MKKSYVYFVRIYGDYKTGLLADTGRIAAGEYLNTENNNILICRTKKESEAKRDKLNAQYQRNGCYWYDVINKEEKTFNFA